MSALRWKSGLEILHHSLLAKKYAVPSLEKHCVDFLKHNLSPDNACMLLTQARLFDEPQLAALCLETIDKYTQVRKSKVSSCPSIYSHKVIYCRKRWELRDSLTLILTP